MLPLTKTQYETLTFIKSFKAEHGYMPGHHDLAQGLNITAGGSTYQRLAQLEAKGYIKKGDGPRNYELIETHD